MSTQEAVAEDGAMLTPGRLVINGTRRSPDHRRSPLPYFPSSPLGVRTPANKELTASPLYNKGMMNMLIHDLVTAATTYQAAYTAGSLLARTVSWYHDADLRYVPEILTPTLLQTVRNDIGQAPTLTHLWLLGILSHRFRLDAGHRPARHLGTVEKELLDLIAKNVYAVSKHILDSITPRIKASEPDNGDGANSVTAILDGVWTSLEPLPDAIREATVEGVITRVLQVVIQNIMLKDINKTTASSAQSNLQPMFGKLLAMNEC
jgi:hypothetical protein